MTSRFSRWAVGVAIASVPALINPATAAAAPSCGYVATELTAGPVTQVPGDGFGQFQFPLILTNIGNEPCTMQGYLDVVLVGPDDPMWGPAFQLRRQSGDPQPITLAPGAAASSVLSYVPGEPDGHWVPTTIIATLPGSSSFQGIPWVSGSTVLRQDGATSPGTYIGPLQAD